MDYIKEKISKIFAAGFCDDIQTKATIKDMFDKGYLSDTHTAVALKVYKDYVADKNDNTPTVIASTASPYKFSSSVLEALCGNCDDISEFDKVNKLYEITKMPVPKSLQELKNKEIRFKISCEKDDMENTVLNELIK